ncbi:hypothetical protein J8I87_28585 [Paraburkholderia sp. LEh10]|uniref:hypothetical protein n=1 Tax=Paraburkholderia sp. LEh10 TaxID=2821353 RepID=UPI001AE2C45A|nr:hypothetical protein [Paraburkholderia sp. LEh10]MBP0593580.1 hypothetical protein [Paraburkholderia sp. LEh10]
MKRRTYVDIDPVIEQAGMLRRSGTVAARRAGQRIVQVVAIRVRTRRAGEVMATSGPKVAVRQAVGKIRTEERDGYTIRLQAVVMRRRRHKALVESMMEKERQLERHIAQLRHKDTWRRKERRTAFTSAQNRADG